MTINYETVEKKFMPVFRAKAALLLSREYNINQTKSAELLGVTQAAVSKYLNKSKSYQNTGIIIDDNEIRLFIDNVINQNEHGAQKHVCKMCQENVRFDCGLMIK